MIGILKGRESTVNVNCSVVVVVEGAGGERGGREWRDKGGHPQLPYWAAFYNSREALISIVVVVVT